MARQFTDKQDLILYRLTIRQADESARETAHVMMTELETSDVYKELVEKEYLTYIQHGEGNKAIAQLIVTLKGERYCFDNKDDLNILDKNAQSIFN